MTEASWSDFQPTWRMLRATKTSKLYILLRDGMQARYWWSLFYLSVGSSIKRVHKADSTNNGMDASTACLLKITEQSPSSFVRSRKMCTGIAVLNTCGQLMLFFRVYVSALWFH